jgi:hypothetical protein
MDCVNSYAPFLQSISVVNYNQLKQVESVEQQVQYMLDQGEWGKAGIEKTNYIVFKSDAGDYVDNWVQGPFMEQFWPNIENYVFSQPDAYWDAFGQDLADDGPIRKKIGIIPQNVTFGGLFQNW